MSIISYKTSTSILKDYTSTNKALIRNSITQQKVRFELPKLKIKELLNEKFDDDHELKKAYIDYVFLIKQNKLNDIEFLRIIAECKECINIFSVKEHHDLIDAVLSLDWLNRNDEILYAYNEFIIDFITIHNSYLYDVITKLILFWIPNGDDSVKWILGQPNDDSLKLKLKYTHNLLNKLLIIIPLAFEIISNSIERLFPYYGTTTFIVTGYVYNIFSFMRSNPMFKDNLLIILIKRFILLDVNAPSNIIEDSECMEENEEQIYDHLFPMELEIEQYRDDEMHNAIAETLDICMNQLFDFIDTECGKGSQNIKYDNRIDKIFKIFLNIFENVILTTHKTHHVQYFMFYLCSFKPSLVETFLIFLWEKFCNPNVSSVIRQSAINYLGSFLARSKYIQIDVIKSYLSNLRKWTDQYIERSDIKNANSLRIHSVFYSVCQTIFYLIAFRSRDLTSNKINLLYLQNLQLSSLVTSHLNPLRVCIPAISTAFASVMRAYQLVYCHTILERNARNKLAKIFANDTTQMQNEFLDSYFPFDPYLLKKSGAKLTPIYMQYQSNEAEKLANETLTICSATTNTTTATTEALLEDGAMDTGMFNCNDNSKNCTNNIININNNSDHHNRRKFSESEDNCDDFIIAHNKKQRLEINSSYSTSPGCKTLKQLL